MTLLPHFRFTDPAHSHALASIDSAGSDGFPLVTHSPLGLHAGTGGTLALLDLVPDPQEN